MIIFITLSLTCFKDVLELQDIFVAQWGFLTDIMSSFIVLICDHVYR